MSRARSGGAGGVADHVGGGGVAVGDGGGVVRVGLLVEHVRLPPPPRPQRNARSAARLLPSDFRSRRLVRSRRLAPPGAPVTQQNGGGGRRWQPQGAAAARRNSKPPRLGRRGARPRTKAPVSGTRTSFGRLHVPLRAQARIRAPARARRGGRV